MLASIPAPPTDRLEFGPLTLRFYGLAIATGALLAVKLARRRFAALGGDPAVVDSATLWAVGGGLAGARVGFVLPRLDRFAEDPLSAFAIWEGGLTFFGALTGALLGVAWYVRRRSVPLSMFLHAVAPSVPLVQAIGRWGNYFNQELYGRPTDLPWALEIEPEHRVAGYEAYDTFHPAFLYESLWNLGLVLLLLWADRRFSLRRGWLFLLYLIGYGVGRFWIELLRIDTDFRVLGLSRNNWNAIAMVVIGLAGLWWWERRAPAATRR